MNHCWIWLIVKLGVCGLEHSRKAVIARWGSSPPPLQLQLQQLLLCVGAGCSLCVHGGGSGSGRRAGTRHYWLGSTGWDQPIQSTSEPRPIGPPELQNPTAPLLSSAKKKHISHPPGKCFSRRNFVVLGWRRWEEGKYIHMYDFAGVAVTMVVTWAWWNGGVLDLSGTSEGRLSNSSCFCL